MDRFSLLVRVLLHLRRSLSLAPVGHATQLGIFLLSGLLRWSSRFTLGKLIGLSDGMDKHMVDG